MIKKRRIYLLNFEESSTRVVRNEITQLIKEEHPDLANEFFKSANYLYPFGILVLKKIKNINR